MAEKKPQSKTARASVRAAQSSGGAVQILGEITYLVPLNGGKNAYVRNIVNGRTPNLRTDSAAFVEEIRVLDAAGHGARISAELDKLHAAHPTHGWDLTKKRLLEAGALSA